MCKTKDIILIEQYKSNEALLDRHSFVVIDDECGEICGIPYDIVCNVMSSFKNDIQRKKKLEYPGNFPVSVSEINVPNGNNREGFIKSDQFYYFNKSNISYRVIGTINDETFNSLIDFINNSDFDIIHITDNI